VLNAMLGQLLGDLAKMRLGRFANARLEDAFLEWQAAQRASAQFAFQRQFEYAAVALFAAVLAGSAAARWSLSAAPALAAAYVAVGAAAIIAAAALLRQGVVDGALATALATGTVSLGWPALSSGAGDELVVARLGQLALAHHVVLSLVAPARTGAAQLVAAASALAFAAECAALLRAAASSSSAAGAHASARAAWAGHGELAATVAAQALLAWFSHRSGVAARRTWLAAPETYEVRKRLAEERAKQTRAGSEGVRSTLSEHAAQCFRLIGDSATMAHMRIVEADIEVMGLLGRGAMGEVYEAMYMEAPVALKRLPVQLLTRRSCELFMQEVKLMKELRHPNVVQLMGVVWNQQTDLLGMVLELMSGSLRSVLQDGMLQLSWEDPKCKLAIDVAKGMAFLHGVNVVHRDLKTDNVLVSSTFTGKVSDFGTSRSLAGQSATQIGTPVYRAPEMLRGEQYDTKVDVFSFAYILLEIATGQDPFDAMGNLEALEFPRKVAHEGFRLPVPEHVPRPIAELIEQCWDAEPGKRPTFTLVRRRLQKFLSELSAGADDQDEALLARVMMDQVIMSGEYTKRKYRDGETVIRCGDTGEECFIVIAGVVDIYVPKTESLDFDEAGWEAAWHKTDPVGQGGFFGEMGMFAATERSATCRARGDVTCFTFARDTFVNKLDKDVHAMVAAKILRCLGDTKRNAAVSSKTSMLHQRILKRVGTMKSKGTLVVQADMDEDDDPDSPNASSNASSTPAATLHSRSSVGGSMRAQRQQSQQHPHLAHQLSAASSPSLAIGARAQHRPIGVEAVQELATAAAPGDAQQQAPTKAGDELRKPSLSSNAGQAFLLAQSDAKPDGDEPADDIGRDHDG
jgi:serine/threonine protein kinase